MRLTCVLVLAIFACSGKSRTTPASSGSAQPIANPYPAKPTGPATAPLSNAPGVKVTLGDVGLEQSSLDRTVDPCVDFYQFTCGGWLANAQLPAGHDRWSRAHEVEDRNRAAIQALLEEAAKGIDPSTKQLGDFYASCMDEATAERNGLPRVKPLLDKIRIKDARGWMPAIAELHASGIWVVWRADTAPDRKSAGTHAMYLDAAGTKLERDLYLDAKAKPQREAYEAHVARMLAFVGTPKPAAAAADVVAIETELARFPRDLADGEAPAKTIDWRAYWKRLGVVPSKRLLVRSRRLFAEIDRVRRRFSPAQWTSYLTFHVVDRVALGFGKAATDEQHALARITSGIEQAPERSERCLDATEAALGELLGQQFVAKQFPASAKQAATALVDALAGALADELARVDWMTEATRRTALAKLAKTRRLVGFPERWRAADAEIARDDFVGNVLRAGGDETRRRLSRWGKPVDRAEWQARAYAIASAYDNTTNTTVLPAGVLQPPFFGADRSVAANLGGLGLVIGRELTKGFDARGGRFDADGSSQPWWTKEDVAKFEARAACVEAQYAGFEALPKRFVNGALTLEENIADMGGVKLAFDAYRALRKDAAKVYLADGYSEDQQFFIAVGQASCTRDRPAEAARRLARDPHAPPKFRIYGGLRNLKAFSEAFACAPGTPMNPATSCSVW